MNHPSHTLINPEYVLAQLAKAMLRDDDAAQARAAAWTKVIVGMHQGKLSIGRRTPVQDTPAWVTLQVIHGGFATGDLAAAGPLQQHERHKLGQLELPADDNPRRSLNLYYLSAPGRAELSAMLASGLFRVRVPEEGALLVFMWLLDQGETLRAQRLLDTLLPWFSKLRFYPSPSEHRVRLGTDVHVRTVREVIERLSARRPQNQVYSMKRAVNVWIPLLDRAVSMLLETMDGPPPTAALEASGQLTVLGGWPARRFPAGWHDRARQLLADDREARRQHPPGRKFRRARETYPRLLRHIRRLLDGSGQLTVGEQVQLRRTLAMYVTRHGVPGGDRHALVRTRQRQNARIPDHHRLARVVVDRLQRYPSDGGVPEVGPEVRPLSADETREVGCEPGVSIPGHLKNIVATCVEAPLELLVLEGLVSSSEMLARTVPQITASIRASSIEQDDLARVYAQVYQAFRARRSLLLLGLAQQVQMRELPWVAAVKKWVGSRPVARLAAEQSFGLVAKAVIQAFPDTVLPNRLIWDLRVLAKQAGMHVNLVHELAADIFWGEFSESFVRAAVDAASVLRGSVYERYFGLPYDDLASLDERGVKLWTAQRTLYKTCKRLAGLSSEDSSWSPPRNGRIIEQVQIITTHNLAALFQAANLRALLQPELPDLARRCLRWICYRQQKPVPSYRTGLHVLKNTAYAWRQMLFYLSLSYPSEQRAFVAWAQEHVSHQRPEFQRRFAPALRGLRLVADGGRFSQDGEDESTGARRFVGWTQQRHWMMASPSK